MKKYKKTQATDVISAVGDMLLMSWFFESRLQTNESGRPISETRIEAGHREEF